jgi:hypothetical protein
MKQDRIQKPWTKADIIRFKKLLDEKTQSVTSDLHIVTKTRRAPKMPRMLSSGR